MCVSEIETELRWVIASEIETELLQLLSVCVCE